MILLYVIYLPATKVDWIFEICYSKKNFNLWRKILETILLLTLHRLISQNYTNSASLFFSVNKTNIYIIQSLNNTTIKKLIKHTNILWTERKRK